MLLLVQSSGVVGVALKVHDKRDDLIGDCLCYIQVEVEAGFLDCLH